MSKKNMKPCNQRTKMTSKEAFTPPITPIHQRFSETTKAISFDPDVISSNGMERIEKTTQVILRSIRAPRSMSFQNLYQIATFYEDDSKKEVKEFSSTDSLIEYFQSLVVDPKVLGYVLSGDGTDFYFTSFKTFLFTLPSKKAE